MTDHYDALEIGTPAEREADLRELDGRHAGFAEVLVLDYVARPDDHVERLVGR